MANRCGCTALTCAELGANCGAPPDGCGGTANCGSTCPAGLSCGGGGEANVCGAPVCSGGWCWTHPVPQGNDLVAIAGTSANDVWAADPYGFFHFDGAQWVHHDFDAPSQIGQIWAHTPADAWAAGIQLEADGGTGGVVERWDGSAWKTVAGAPSASYLDGTWGSGSQVFAVGSGIFRFDGSSWTTDFASGVDLYAVSGSAANDVWAVGKGGLLVHWDGSSWSPDATSTNTNDLYAVWGDTANDFWAVGATATALHWNGTGWSPATVAAFSGDTFDSVWGSGPNDVWIGASSGDVFHWDGLAWTPSTATPRPIYAIWGSAPGDLWAVGQGGDVHHHDASGWTLGENPGTRATRANGIWAISPEDVWVVGYSSTTTGNVPGVSHWDGRAWRLIETGLSGALEAVWAGGHDDVWVASDSGVGHFDGRAWTGTNLGERIDSIWGSASNDVWAGGTTMHHFDGLGWISVALPGATGSVSAIWGSGAHDVWALSSGKAFHWDGTAWTAFAAATADGGSTQFGTIIWGASASDVYASANLTGSAEAANLALDHWNGTAWRALANQPTEAIGGLAGSSATQIWAVGVTTNFSSGAIESFDGTTWTTQASFGIPGLSKISVTGPSDAWAIVDTTATPTVMHWDGAVWRTVNWTSLNEVGAQSNSGYALDATHNWLFGDDLSLDTSSSPSGGLLFSHDNGASFGATGYPAASGNNGTITAVWASSATDVWYGGRSGAVYHQKNGVWSSVSSGLTSDATGLWGAASNSIWAIDCNNIVHFNGLAWSAQTVPSGAGCLEAIAGSSANDVWAVGQGATAIHWDGTAWTSLNTGFNANNEFGTINGVWESSAGDAWAVSGDFGSGTLWHWNGASWDPKSSWNVTLYGVWGTDPNDIWFVGDQGLIGYWNGTTAVDQAPSLVEAPLTGVWGLSGSGVTDVWAAGDDGALVHLHK